MGFKLYGFYFILVAVIISNTGAQERPGFIQLDTSLSAENDGWIQVDANVESSLKTPSRLARLLRPLSFSKLFPILSENLIIFFKPIQGALDKIAVGPRFITNILAKFGVVGLLTNILLFPVYLVLLPVIPKIDELYASLASRLQRIPGVKKLIKASVAFVLLSKVGVRLPGFADLLPALDENLRLIFGPIKEALDKITTGPRFVTNILKKFGTLGILIDILLFPVWVVLLPLRQDLEKLFATYGIKY